MELKKRNDFPGADSRLGKTVYTISFGSGKEVFLERSHYTGHISACSPLPAGISEQELIMFLRENGPKEDFTCPVFERKYPYSHSAVRDTCYSIEQAFLLAEEEWERRVVRAGKTSAWFDPSRDLFRISCYIGGKKQVIKDWLQ